MIANQRTYLKQLSERLKNFDVKEQPYNIVFHGHSIPCGYTVSRVVRSCDAYPQLVRDALNIRFPNAVLNSIVVGVGGENAVEGAKRVQTVLAHQPSLVVVDFGRNDIFVPLEQTKNAWKTMIETYLNANLKVLLLTPSPDDGSLYYAPEQKKATDEEVSEMIRELAAEYEIGCADVAVSFQHRFKNGYSPSDFLAGVNHPNHEGHQEIACEILRWIPTVF